MTIIGLTGGIGTGKSTVAKMFKRLGAVVLDADEIGHRLIEPGKPAWKKIVARFGHGILRRDHYIDRKALGKQVFSDKRRLKELCDIIHPLVYKEMRVRIKDIARADPSAIVVLDVPLLLETGGEKYMDEIVVVSASRKSQLERSIKKFGMTKPDAMRRINAQMPLKDKAQFADFVVDNDGSIISTEKQVRLIWKRLVAA